MQLSPQNLANPTGQFWRAGVGYVGQHGVARGGTQRQLVRASIAAALGGGRWEGGWWEGQLLLVPAAAVPSLSAARSAHSASSWAKNLMKFIFEIL